MAKRGTIHQDPGHSMNVESQRQWGRQMMLVNQEGSQDVKDQGRCAFVLSASASAPATSSVPHTITLNQQAIRQWLWIYTDCYD